MTGNNGLSPSITTLLELMAGDGPLRRKIESAEVLLSYEVPLPVGEYVRSFLTGLIEDRTRVTGDYRLKASALLRRFEAKKIAQRSIGSASAGHWNEVWRSVRAGRRRLKLDQLGLWPPPPDPNWCADIMADDDPLRPSEYPR
jgi:hypothetical protein